MAKDIFINFCLYSNPCFGGTYTAESLFREALNTYFIDLKRYTELEDYKVSEADFSIPGSINPFLSLLTTNDLRFFSFIPDEIKSQAKGIIVHSIFMSHYVYAYKLSCFLNLPLYIVPHGSTDPYVFSYNQIIKKVWLKIIGQPISNQATKIIFASQSEQQKSILSNANTKGVICHWAVTPPLVINREESRRYIRQKLGISENDKILIYLSRLEKMKRPLETLQSFLKVQPQGWKFVMIGPYDVYSQDQSLQTELEQYSQHPNIKLLPPIFGEEKWQFLAGADLYILLSHRENFGFTIAEAASIGLPIYISKGVDIHPFFQNFNIPLVFEIESSQDIDQVMATLENLTEQQLKSAGKFCQNIVLKYFNFDKFSQTIQNILMN